MNYELKTYADRTSLAVKMARCVADRLRERLLVNDRVTLAVPGGTTPVEFLKRLGAQTLEWDRVNVLPTDERFVPEDSLRSNGGMIRRTLLAGGNPGHVANFVALSANAENVLRSLANSIGHVKAVLPLDVSILGMGQDMHTASLFPNAVGIRFALSAAAPPLVALCEPSSGEERISLSASTLRNASVLHVVFCGREKLEAWEKALSIDQIEMAPIRVVLGREATSIIHYAP